MALEVLLERYPYRYVQCGTLEINGKPDYRIQKFNEITRLYNDMYLLDNSVQLDYVIEDFEYTQRYKDMYLLDNSIQLDYVMEDFEYTKWLDPDPEVGSYRSYN